MKLLVWIMSRFNVPPELIGDIAEDYAEHRSCPRLARQTSAAVTTTMRSTLQSDPRRLLAAIATGWTLHLGLAFRLWVIFGQTSLMNLRPLSITTGLIMASICRVQPVGAVVLYNLTCLIYDYFTWPPGVRFHRVDRVISLLVMTAAAMLIKPRSVSPATRAPQGDTV